MRHCVDQLAALQRGVPTPEPSCRSEAAVLHRRAAIAAEVADEGHSASVGVGLGAGQWDFFKTISAPTCP